MIRIFERAKETKVIKIQRLVRRVFHESNHMIRSGSHAHLLTNFTARIATTIYEYHHSKYLRDNLIILNRSLNAVALTVQKAKVKKAQTLMCLLMEQALFPMGMVKATDIYMGISKEN